MWRKFTIPRTSTQPLLSGVNIIPRYVFSTPQCFLLALSSSCPSDGWLHNHPFPLSLPQAPAPCNSQITTYTEFVPHVCFWGTELWHPKSDLEIFWSLYTSLRFFVDDLGYYEWFVISLCNSHVLYQAAMLWRREVEISCWCHFLSHYLYLAFGLVCEHCWETSVFKHIHFWLFISVSVDL